MSRAVSSVPVSSPPQAGAPQHPVLADRRWVATALPLLFFGWMYGGSLLLLLGLLNEIGYLLSASPLTGWYYGAGVAVALLAPAAGLVLARLLRRPGWVRPFRTALVLSVLASCLVGVAWSAAPALRAEPAAPADTVERPNPYQDCVSISGGTNTCPGG